MILIGESAWLPPCVVLVINDNLYGLIFALSSMCRLSFRLCQDHALIKAKLACLHLLESSLREEKMCVDQGFVRLDQLSSPSEDMPKSAFPILVYGGASCESSPSEAQSRKVGRLEEMKIVFIDLKWIKCKAKV